MPYYSRKTTSQNRIDHPTPYLCLKSRLTQSILNRNTILCIFVFLVINFIKESVSTVSDLSNGDSIQLIKRDTSNSNNYNLSLSLNSLELINSEKQSIIDSIIHNYENSNLMLLDFLDISFQSQYNFINESISDGCNLVGNTTSAIQLIYQNIISELNSSIMDNLVGENENLQRLKTEITDSSIYIGNSVDLSSLKINYTEIESSFQAYMINKVNVSANSDLVDLNNTKDAILIELQEIYDYNVPIFNETVYSLIDNLQSIDNFTSDYIFNYTDIELSTSSSSSSSNSSDKNIGMLTNDSEIMNQVEKKSRRYGIYILTLSISSFIIDLVWQWIKFRFEQDCTKNLIIDLEQTEDQLSPVLYITNPLTYFISHWFIKFIYLVWSKAFHRIYSCDNEVSVYWFINFTFGNEANLFGFVQFGLIFATFYAMLADMLNFNSTGSNSAIYSTDISSRYFYSSNITDTDSGFNEMMKSYNEELNNSINRFIGDGYAKYENQLLNLTSSVQSLYSDHFENKTVLSGLKDSISNFITNSSFLSLSLSEFNDTSISALSLTKLQINEISVNMATGSTIISSKSTGNILASTLQQLARNMSKFRAFGLVLIGVLVVYQVGAFAYFIYRTVKERRTEQSD